MFCKPSTHRHPIQWARRLLPGALVLVALLAAGCGDDSAEAEAQDRSNDPRPGWTDISLGPTHTLGIAANGTLWSWGSNSLGQLGIGVLGGPDQYSPVQVGSSHKWSRVAAGNQFSLATRLDGTLWSWGSHVNGQLGLGVTTGPNQPTPVQIGSATTWTKVAAGSNFVAALQSNGTLWTWGDDTQGQLGHDPTNPSLPSQIPAPGSGLTWVDLRVGSEFVLAIASDRQLWAWGRNQEGQLGDTTTTSPRTVPQMVAPPSAWLTVSAGSIHSMGIKTDGSLHAWGDGNQGAHGLPNATRTAPTPVTGVFAKAVVASLDFTIIIRPDGTRWSTGVNGNGSLGIGNITNQTTFFQEPGGNNDWSVLLQGYGAIHAGAYKSDASLWLWGANGAGQIGDGTNTMRTSPKNIK